jgi:hypothetical protein
MHIENGSRVLGGEAVKVLQVGFYTRNRYKPETRFLDIPEPMVIESTDPIYSQAVKRAAETAIDLAADGHWINPSLPRGPMLVMENHGYYNPMWGIASYDATREIMVHAGASEYCIPPQVAQGRYEMWCAWKTAEEDVDLWIRVSFHQMERDWLGGIEAFTTDGVWVTNGAAVGFQKWRQLNEVVHDVLRGGQNRLLGREKGLSAKETAKMFNKMIKEERFCGSR